MGVKIVRGKQTYSDGSIQRSQGAGNIEVLWDQTFYQLTTDKGVFGIATALFVDPDVFFVQAPDAQGGVTEFTIDKDVLAELGTGGVLNKFRVKTPGNNLMEAFRDTVNNQNVILFNAMPVFADNAAAIAGGLGTGSLYRTGGAVNITTP